MPVTPHSITAKMSGVESDELWVQGTLELMRRCDAVLVLPGYERSEGTKGEIAEAERLKLPIFAPSKPRLPGSGPYPHEFDRLFDRVEYSIDRLKSWLETRADGTA